MIKLIKELEENNIILLLVEGIDYSSIVVDMAKQLSKKNVCYITLNKSFPALKETFEKKIDTSRMVFIDAISRTISDKPPQANNVYYLSSPRALTELSMAITKSLRHDFDYIILDSLTNLLIYESKAPVAKFVTNLVTEIKASKTKAIFYALKIDQHQELIQECSMSVDNVIDLTKKRCQKMGESGRG